MNDLSTLFMGISSMIIILLCLATIVGILLKLLLAILELCAYPTYIGLYFLEQQLPRYKILKLNVSDKGWGKIIMNICATIITFANLTVLTFLTIFFYQQRITTSINPLPYEKILPPSAIVVYMLCLVIIYIVSYYFTDIDNNTPHDKIDKLKVPPLLRIFF